MGKELKEVEEEVNIVVEKIKKQAQHHAETTIRVRKVLLDYFFDVNIINTLTESPDSNHELFNVNAILEPLKACLVEESKLVEKAEAIKHGARSSLVEALDANIQETHLPFIRSKEGYAFYREIPYTPKAQSFMEQFAHALSVYRICLGICEAFHYMSGHACLDLQEYYAAISKAEHLKAALKEPGNATPVIDSWRLAKDIKRQLRDLVKVIDAFTSDFECTIEQEQARLKFLMEGAAEILQDSYRKFPNTATLPFLFSDQWQTTAKMLDNLLYPEKTKCSQLSSEISEFKEIVNAKLPILKTELLVKAFKLVDSCLSRLRIEAHRKHISLAEAPENGVFPLYWSLAKLSLNNSRGNNETTETSYRNF